MRKHLTREDRYIRKRLRRGKKESKFFLRSRQYPINPAKIVFTTIEGTTGFSCNPKYIALELLRRRDDLDIVWLVDDITKEFPPGIRKVKNTLQNRAYELSTAAIWVDNSRKQLECRKRKEQFYIQTWHASMHIKPTGLARGASFSKMARIVTKHDALMTDILLTNSRWVEERAKDTLLYNGATYRSGSPRVDFLLKERENCRRELHKKYGLDPSVKLMMYAPTFRSGSQGTTRAVTAQDKMPDFKLMRAALERRFGGKWAFALRLHPQLTARNITTNLKDDDSYVIVDVSKEDDMSETLAACDALLTDYSAMAFDASYAKLPVFIYCYDLEEYIAERGDLMWDLNELPFLIAKNDEELSKNIEEFDENLYNGRLEALFEKNEVLEDGKASIRAADIIESRLGVKGIERGTGS